MKIAFVGKGGSGKSTMTALYIRYLQSLNRQVLAIDADLNMNLAGLLKADIPNDIAMADSRVANAIRHYLKGSNPRLQDISKFLPTTPPGTGSNIVRQADDPNLAPYAIPISDDPVTRLMMVGSYDRDGIGQTCYHTHLFVAENLLSHTRCGTNFDVVCDMVAGNDAFAYSLHLQFDAIILIAEPTPESVEVCRLYMDLARQAGIDSLVHCVANKIVDQDDANFVTTNVGQAVLAMVPSLPLLKKSRQRGDGVGMDMVVDPVRAVMEKIDAVLRAPLINEQERMQKLNALHEKLSAKKWVQQGYGDVMQQIDPAFQENAA